MRSEDLITQLAADLKPVRRVWDPMVASAVWTGLALVVIAGAVAFFGFRHDLQERLESGFDLPQILLAVATGLLAVVAAFHLALPDRSRHWALLPLPAAIGWLATIGWGCLQDVLREGPGALLVTTSFPCLAFIAGFGLPLTAALVWLARHAVFVRPGPVAALGGLAAAAIASAGLTLTHHLDAATMVLVWHGMSVVLVMLVAKAFGPRLMRAAQPEPA